MLSFCDVTVIMKSVFAFCFVAIFALLPVSDATLEDQILKQLNFLSEKYLDLEKKYIKLDEKFEILVKENEQLKHKLDVLSKENMQKEIISHVQTANFNRTGSYKTTKSNYSIDTGKALEGRIHDPEAVSDLQALPDALENNNSSSVQFQKDHRSTNHVTRGTIQQHIPLVAFTAILTHQLFLGQNQAIEYNNVLTNLGSAYDSRHGHFVAPENGLYLMSFTITNRQPSTASLEMVKNGLQLAQVYGDSNDYNMGTQVLFVVLQKGDMVWIRHSSPTPQTLHGYGYNTFSGVLLAVFE